MNGNLTAKLLKATLKYIEYRVFLRTVSDRVLSRASVLVLLHVLQFLLFGIAINKVFFRE